MTEVLQANIFFLITGIAVIVFTFLLCIALYHVIRILKSLRRVMDRIEAGSEIIAEDMQSFRAYFTEEGLISRVIGSIFGSRTKGREAKRPARDPGKKTTEPTKKAERNTKTELKIKGEE